MNNAERRNPIGIAIADGIDARWLRHLRREESMRYLAAASLLFATAACATTPEPFTVTAFGGESTLRCAAAELRAAGYDIDLDEHFAEASRVQQRAPAEADRDLVNLDLVTSEEPFVRATLTRWNYSPSNHSLPVGRQYVQPVAVDERTSSALSRIMRSCQTP